LHTICTPSLIVCIQSFLSLSLSLSLSLLYLTFYLLSLHTTIYLLPLYFLIIYNRRRWKLRSNGFERSDLYRTKLFLRKQ
jgi:hypothetical protein